MRLFVLLAAVPVLFGQTRSAAPPRSAPHPAPVHAAPVPGSVAPVALRPAPVRMIGYYPYVYAPIPDEAAVPAPADPQPQGPPSLIVNPNYVPETSHPVMYDYSYLPAGGGSAAAPPAAPQVVFLIAMKDHTIYPAIAYWVENSTLNYISREGVRKQVGLGDVDREFSEQLNKEREIDFALPIVTAH